MTSAVGGKAALYYLPLALAERLGYFEDEGLQVEILDFPGGARSLRALHDALAGFEPVVRLRRIDLAELYINRFVDAALAARR